MSRSSDVRRSTVRRRVIESERAGRITFITGPMFAGKSERLVRRLRRADRAKRLHKDHADKKEVLVLKPSSDTRDMDAIRTQEWDPENGYQDVVWRKNTFLVNDSNPEEALQLINRIYFDVFAVDEVQFFGSWLEYVVKDLAWNTSYLVGGNAPWRRGYARNEWIGREVMLAGLSLDFLGRPFGIAPSLSMIADKVENSEDAYCNKCGRAATLTQRKLDTVPEDIDWLADPLVMPGGKDQYEARCKDCWVDPRPEDVLRVLRENNYK